MQIKIVLVFKLKHISAQISKKKEKTYVEFDIRKFDNQKTQGIVKVSKLALKGL